MKTKSEEVGTVSADDLLNARLDVIEAAIADMPTWLGEIRDGLAGSIKRIEKANSIIEELSVKVTSIDPATYVTMEQRGAYLSDRLRLLIDKITVLTEVSFYARNGRDVNSRAQILAAVVWAFDRDDDWWADAYYDLSVEGWAKRCMDAYRADRLLNLTTDKLEEVSV